MFIGLVLIAVGVLALLIAAGVLTGAAWSYIWPIILILLGVSILMGRGRRHATGTGCGGRPGTTRKRNRTAAGSQLSAVKEQDAPAV